MYNNLFKQTCCTNNRPTMQCEFCNQILSSRDSLRNHKKSATYCLKIQGKNDEIKKKLESNCCSYCGDRFTARNSLKIHQIKCALQKAKSVDVIDNNDDNEILDQIKQENCSLHSQLDKTPTKREIEECVITHHEVNNHNESIQSLVNQGKIPSNELNKLTLYQVSQICQPIIYEELLEQKTTIAICDFVKSIGLSMDIFQIDQFWDCWKHSDKYIIINKDMLDWLGYEGDYKIQLQLLLELLTSNFQANKDYLYDGSFEATIVTETVENRQKENIIAVSWICLKQISMMLSTREASRIKSSIICQEIVFKLYMQYRYDLQIRHIEKTNADNVAEIDRLKRIVAIHEKNHQYVKFNLNSTYYCFSYGRKCIQGCPTRDLIKHGIAVKGTKGSTSIDIRMRNHRSTFKLLNIEFIISALPAVVIMLEKNMELCYGKNLNPNASEIFDKIGANVLKAKVINFLEMFCPGQYCIVSQQKIDEYNRDVDLMIKDIKTTDEIK